MRDCRHFETGADVPEFAREALDSGKRTALVVITSTLGSDVRAAGALAAENYYYKSRKADLGDVAPNGCFVRRADVRSTCSERQLSANIGR